MRSVRSRLARLEQVNRQRTAPQRLGIQYGYLETLPDDYIGPRHVVTVMQIPPEELPPAERAKPWFEWEERPGPQPVTTASHPTTRSSSRSATWRGKAVLKPRTLRPKTATDTLGSGARIHQAVMLWNGPSLLL